jgi:hypothetical protein
VIDDAKRRGLGRGLSALLGEEEAAQGVVDQLAQGRRLEDGHTPL